MATPTNNIVSVKETDYLDEDKPIRGQNYALLSFLSPEDVLARKDVFLFENYLASFSKQLHELFDGLAQKYPDDASILNQVKENNQHIFDPSKLQHDFQFFVSKEAMDLDSKFHEKEDFKTTVRGVKVRGVFDTMKEAQVRAELLKRMGDKFDIYVAQVGCWCPWAPNPDALNEQEYAEDHLNTLMKKYKENMNLRDEFFEQRKQEKIETAIKETAAKKATLVTEEPMAVDAGLQEGDAWLERKEQTSEN